MHKILFIATVLALASFTSAALLTPAVNLVVTYPNGHVQFQYGDMATYTTSVAPIGNGTNPVPTGTVNVQVDGQTRATCSLSNNPSANTVCSVNETMTPVLTVGPHNFTSVYSGDGNYTTATSTIQTLRVFAQATITLTISPSNPQANQAVTITVATTSTNPSGQSPLPSGTVGFFNGANSLGSCPSLTNGGCTFTVGPNIFTPGSVTIVGAYSGDTVYAPVNVSTSFTVGTATTSTTSTSTTATTSTTTSTTAASATIASAATTDASTTNANTGATTDANTGASTTNANTGASTTNANSNANANSGAFSTAFTGSTSGAAAVCGSVFVTILAVAIAL